MRQALIIGIDKYPGQSLKGCVADAEALAGILQYNNYPDKSPNFDIKLQTNIQSKTRLKALIKELFCSDSDVALFYFSGHGYADESGGYLVTPDGVPNDPGILMDELLLYANRSEIKTKIIILDCCNAGSFGTPVNMEGMTQIRKGLVILTSSREAEPSKESNGHGLFTNLLLGALKGAAADLMGDITPAGIYAHIDAAIGNWGQRPMFRANVSRFTPISKVKPRVDVSILKKITQIFPYPEAECRLDPSFEWTNTSQAIARNVETFKCLQQMNRAGLVIPKGHDDMYFAAMNSKSCQLSPLGQHYWMIIYENRL